MFNMLSGSKIYLKIDLKSGSDRVQIQLRDE